MFFLQGLGSVGAGIGLLVALKDTLNSLVNISKKDEESH